MIPLFLQYNFAAFCRCDPVTSARYSSVFLPAFFPPSVSSHSLYTWLPAETVCLRAIFGSPLESKDSASRAISFALGRIRSLFFSRKKKKGVGFVCLMSGVPVGSCSASFPVEEDGIGDWCEDWFERFGAEFGEFVKFVEFEVFPPEILSTIFSSKSNPLWRICSKVVERVSSFLMRAWTKSKTLLDCESISKWWVDGGGVG